MTDSDARQSIDHPKTGDRRNASQRNKAILAQQLKANLRARFNWKWLSPGEQQGLEQLADDIADILSGKPNRAALWGQLALRANEIAKTVQEDQQATDDLYRF